MSFNNNKRELDGHDLRGKSGTNNEANLSSNRIQGGQESFHIRNELPVINDLGKPEEEMLIQDEKRKYIKEKGPNLKSQRNQDSEYYQYQKGIKKKGESAQMRFKSKLNFLLSGFKEQDSVGSVSYYNDSARSQSSSSESIHSNEINPFISNKHEAKQSRMNGKRNQQGSDFQEIPLMEAEKKEKVRKYLFYEEQQMAQSIKAKKYEDERQHFKSMNKSRNKENNVIFGQDPESRQLQNQVKHINQPSIKGRQREKKEGNVSLDSTILRNQYISQREELQHGNFKSVSYNKESYASKVSNISKNNRYNKEESQQEPSRKVSSIQIINPKLPSQNLQLEEKVNPWSSNINKEIVTISNKQELSEYKLNHTDKEQHLLKMKDNTQNDIIEDFRLNGFNKDRVSCDQKISQSFQEKNHLQTINHQSDTKVEELNQFLPKNAVSFHIQPKRKIKSELSERPEERKKMLTLLKRRQEALAKKVREQMKITPKLFKIGSGQSNISSVPSNDYENPHQLSNNPLQNNGKYTLNSYTDRFQATTIQKHYFNTPNGKPYFPTENLKKNNRKVHQPRLSTEYQSSEEYFPKLALHNEKLRHKTDIDLSNKGSSREDQNVKDLRGRNMIHYNLNKFHREHQVITNKNTSAKEKYFKLKRLISQL